VSKHKVLEQTLTSEVPLNELWNSLLSPDPFPGNLFISDGATYVCNSLGTGRNGGFRFEYGNSQWLILRPTLIDPSELKIIWHLVDIKKGRTEIKIKLFVRDENIEIKVSVCPKFSFGWNLLNFLNTKKLENRLQKISI
jgi:hypothetical protein